MIHFYPMRVIRVELARNHPYLHLEIPKRGGHVGFSLRSSKINWMEKRAFEFVVQNHQ
jgi:predicted alpha/beta-fold hydrolase